MSQIKKGALLNYITIFLTNVVGLFITPFILNHLGKSEYGIYTAIGALVGTISVLDLGLNNTIIRFVAKYKAEKDRRSEENFLATTMLIYIAISIVIVIIGFIFYGHIDSYFTKMNSEEINISKTIFILLIFNLAIGLPGGSFVAICYGYENFVFPKSINVVRYLLRTIVVVSILLMGGKAIALVIIDTVFNILFMLTEAYFVFFKLKVRIKLHYFSSVFLKKIFSYSIWIFVYGIVAQFQWKSGQIVLGNFSNTEVLAVYAIGLTLGSYYGAFSSAITGVFLPRATQMIANNASPAELTDTMIKIGRVSFIVLMYVLGAFYLYGKQFVFLWVGESYYDSYLIAVIIMVVYTIPLVQGFTGPLIEAQNKVAFKAVIYLVFLALGTLLGFFLAKKHGAIGMIGGTVIGWFIAQNVMNVFYHRVLKLDVLRFFKELFNKILISFLFILAIGYFINYIPGNGWINFIAKASIYSIAFIVIMYKFGTIPYEKELFSGIFTKIRN
ncbi:lipopolysaccharide biosynthesis protein [Algibacter sp. L4_22]|uniref:lipopolysaccharide biosynthesis protein n=1 Tax=Algibacter sp. L4_22 TaxID=2942477 RepID=UPI00201B7003|nr:oligosaccharide flippase family protein [Algibacter sp. L4_22]MCL5127852.1 oligosaccharide flippase family protein [Algibacter sp. L4_22]